MKIAVSYNKSNAMKELDEAKYDLKIQALRKSYSKTSSMTDFSCYIFYIPIKVKDEWQIWKYQKGNEELITEDTFKNIVLNGCQSIH